jgi:SAM-dependent methyltransferase
MAIADERGIEEYTDPRFTALYDAANPWGDDSRFYMALAAQLSAPTIIDIGCGTGSLATALAGRGHAVTGLDPSPAMIEVARHRPGATSVRFILGPVDLLDDHYDLALMTGHVAQVISDDHQWQTTLAAVHGALVAGGHLAFESRHPDPRRWVREVQSGPPRRVEDPHLGTLEVWSDGCEVSGNVVHFLYHHRIVSSGQELVSRNQLRFRSREELTTSLTDVGFQVNSVVGHWDGRPVDPDSPELIFVARRP